MSNYITTNIRIHEDDYLRLKQEAARKRKSLSAVIGEKIKGVVPEEYAHKLASIKGDWLAPQEITANRQEIEKRLKSLFK